MTTRDFEVDQEFRDYLPFGGADDLAMLRSLIVAAGRVDELVVFDIQGRRILGDGHKRLVICEAEGIPYGTRTIHMPDRQACKRWMLDNQFARRNLTAEERSYYRGKEYLLNKQTQGGDHKSDDSKSNGQSGQTTAKEIADRHHVGEKTIRRDAQFTVAVDAKPAEEKAAILKGDTGKTREQITLEGKILCNPCKKLLKKGQELPVKCPECEDIRANGKPKPAPKRKKHSSKEATAAWKTFTNHLEAIRDFIDKAPVAFAWKDKQALADAQEVFDGFAAEMASWRAQVQRDGAQP